MRHIAATAALAVLFLAGCSGLYSENVDPAQFDAAQRRYHDCLGDAAKHRDDPRISQDEAAERVEAACAAQWTALTDMEPADNIDSMTDAYKEERRNQAHGDAVTAVATARKANHYPGY